MRTVTLLTTLALLPALMLGPLGCETMSEHKVASGTAIGAAGGAALGAVIGHQSGHKGEGALIGAATGALVGAGTGYWLDRRSQKFNAVQDPNTAVDPVPAQTYRTPEGDARVEPEHITLRLNDTMLFDRGSSAISPQGGRKLDEIAKLLAENPRERIVVRGYAGSEGGDQSNVDLSKRRAQMVANYFVGKGVNPGRITPLGMGASNPIAANDTETGRAENRRVEIEIFPPEESAGGGY
jgi:outer membrane protein OmpA-like peptidoglycan-associated protein